MICAVLLYIFLSAWVVWAIFATRLVNYWFFHKFKYLSSWGAQFDPQYKGYNRNDFQNWDRRKMTLGAIFLLPFRFVSLFGTIASGIVILRLLMLFYGIRKFEIQTEAFQRTSSWVFKKLVRVCLFCLGFHRIETIKKPLKKTYAKLKSVKTQKTSLIIANHVSIADMLYLLSREENLCFMAKSSTANMPLIGFYVRFLQCVLVDRMDLGSRKDSMAELHARVEQIEAGLAHRPIAIFPEGKVTNGFSLQRFKRGAFVNLKPVKVVGLKFQGAFSASCNMIPLFDSFLGLLMQPSNELTVVEIEGLVAPNGEMGWQEFAVAVQKMMCEEIGFQACDCTLEQIIEFHKKHAGMSEADFK